MKKLIVVPILVLAYSIASAQKFELGPKAGVNISNFSSSNSGSKTKVGFHLGGFLAFKLGENFAVQPEVLFSTQGAKYDSVNFKELKANYLNVPVLVQLRMPGGLYLETGPQAGILLTADLDDQTIKDTYRSLDWSWAFGLGFRSKMGLGLGARYNLGLTKVRDDISTSSFETDAKNSVFQVGLFFNLIH
jgi:outer membrane protein with beta-barrel domain